MTHKFDIDPVTTNWPMPSGWPRAPQENSNKVLMYTCAPWEKECALQTKELEFSLNPVATGATVKPSIASRIKQLIARGLRV